MAEVVLPLRVFLEEHMVGAKRRNERVSSNWAISAGEWTSELIGTWDAAQDLVAHAVALSHPRPGWAVCSCSRMPPASIGGLFSRRCLRGSSTAAFQSMGTRCFGLDNEESSWEDLAKTWDTAPQCEVGIAQFGIEAGSTDTAEAAIWYLAVSSVAFCV